MIGNMGDGKYEDDSYDMLEKLPRVVRLALAHADYDWCIESFLDFYRSSGSPSATISKVREADEDGHRDVARLERRTVISARGRAFR